MILAVSLRAFPRLVRSNHWSALLAAPQQRWWPYGDTRRGRFLSIFLFFFFFQINSFAQKRNLHSRGNTVFFQACPLCHSGHDISWMTHQQNQTPPASPSWGSVGAASGSPGCWSLATALGRKRHSHPQKGQSSQKTMPGGHSTLWLPLRELGYHRQPIFLCFVGTFSAAVF